MTRTSRTAVAPQVHRGSWGHGVNRSGTALVARLVAMANNARSRALSPAIKVINPVRHRRRLRLPPATTAHHPREDSWCLRVLTNRSPSVGSRRSLLEYSRAAVGGSVRGRSGADRRYAIASSCHDGDRSNLVRHQQLRDLGQQLAGAAHDGRSSRTRLLGDTIPVSGISPFL